MITLSPPTIFSSKISRLSLFVTLLILITLLSFPLSANPAEKPLDQISLMLKWKHQFQSAGYYAAIEKGFYQEAGLEVTLIEPSVNSDPVMEVVNGNMEFGATGPNLLLYRAKGHPVVALATIFQHSPLVLLARENSGINSIHDLVGKRVMVEYASAELEAYLQSEGIFDTKYTRLTHTHSPDDFINGSVDAISAYSTDELYLINKANCKYTMLSPRSAGIDFYGDLLFTTQEQIDQHPERVDAFLAASKKGWQYALQNPEEIVDLIYEKYSKRHSREHLLFEARESQRLIFADIVEVGYMNPGRWQFIANTYAKLNMIPANFSLNGFIYDPDPTINLTWLYNILATAFILLIVFFNFALSYLVKKRTLELTKAKENAEMANKAKSQFLANMSHELRTPLNSVIGFTELLVSSPLEYVQSQYAQNANISGHVLLGIINNILDFSKIEAGKLELSNTRTDIIKFLEQTISILSYQAECKKLDLLLNISPEVPRFIFTDPIRLGQVLINLMSNAIKFTEVGEVELRLEFSKTSDNEGVFKFLIRDTGIGISDADRKRIFNEFTQADNSDTRKFGGTGLGLSISRMLVEKMGGTLQLKSELGKGSSFYFSITRNYEPGVSPASETIHSTLQHVPNIKLKPKIMVVEDVATNRIYACGMIKKLLPAATIIEAINGQQALDIFLTEKPDLILMDIQMPIINGYQASRKIRRLEAEHGLPRTTIIAITASALAGELNKCLEAGMDDCATKPIVPQQFSKILHSHLKT